MDLSSFITPGYFELYAGPMKSKKTGMLLDRADPLHFVPGCTFRFAKPSTDTRDGEIFSRSGDRKYPCWLINSEHPEDLLPLADPKMHMLLIDEIQLFGAGIESVIDTLVRRNHHVIAAGLDLDFRGEPFGQIPYLLAMADEVHKRHGVCEYNGCTLPASRTQRLIDNEPAPYGSPLIMIEGAYAHVTYQCRCLKHHDVPGKPLILADRL